MAATVERTVRCPRCLVTSPVRPGEPDFDRECPGCSARLEIHAFPPLFSDSSEGADKGILSGDGDAVCQFYPELQAETVCGECGCFMSKKAAVDWAGRTICMPCLHSLRENVRKDEFLPRRRLYDHTALGIMLYLLPVSFVTAPIALYMLLRHRNASRGIIPRSRFRWWLALVLATVLISMWTFLFVGWFSFMVRALG